MRASSRKLAALLATRLDEILPPSLSARAEGPRLSIFVGDEAQCGSAAAVLVEDDDDELDARLETAIRAVLSGVQDCVIRHQREPWPESGRQGALPMPGARVEQGLVQLWFGDEHAPDVRLTPFERSQLME
jgi:hypothetical protein